MAELGDRVRYKINGFEGIVSGKIKWLHGCDQVHIKPERLDDKGKPVEGGWYDEPWVEVIKAGVFRPLAAVESAVGGKRTRISGAPTDDSYPSESRA